MPRPLYWLHLSDLHFGAKGKEILNQVTLEFYRGLRNLARTTNHPPDLVIVTGDVAFAGRPEEYQQADEFIIQLREELSGIYGSCNPLLVFVPGNHDLVRPSGKDVLTYDVFSRYAVSSDDDANVRFLNDMLWNKRDASLLTPLFENYQNWVAPYLSELRKRQGVKLHTSHFPGDLCMEVNLPGVTPLCIVGLNSAWLQYSDAEFERKLAVVTRQFQAVLPPRKGSNPLEVFKRYARALLVMHHPPAWLSNRLQDEFYSEIYLPDRFDMCLFGHMHAGRSQQTAISGGSPRFEYQSPSLCGLENYGKSNETRTFGFSFGSLSDDGEIRIWPYQRVFMANREYGFFWDQSYGDVLNEGILVRPGEKTSGLLQPAVELSEPADTSTEGAVLRVVLVDFIRAEYQRSAVIEFLNRQFLDFARKLIPQRTLEVIDCNWDGEFTFFLPRARDQGWSTLLQQALQLIFQVETMLLTEGKTFSNSHWTPQVAVALHVEHEGYRLPPPPSAPRETHLLGEGIDYARSMLPKPIRPYILLSDEAYRYVYRIISDTRSIDALLPETFTKSIPGGKTVRLDIRKLSMAPQVHNTALPDQPAYWESHEVFNLVFWSARGDLLLGDTHIPPNRVRIDYGREADEQALVERLLDADRVSIIGVTNENLAKPLHKALRQRRENGKDFWEEIKVVFLLRDLLDSVLDARCTRYEVKKSQQDRRDSWSGGVREVREFFLGCGSGVSHRWECLEFNYHLPFEAQRFDDSDGNSLIRMVPIMPNVDARETYFIEATGGYLLHNQLSDAIDVIIRTATPIVEFNVYGHATDASGLTLAGVVSQREWRSFKPPEGGRPCFPVAFIMLHTNVGGVQQLLLQNRTVLNTGGDYDLFSLISGKVNDEDFFFPGNTNKEYQKLAYQVSSAGNDLLRQQLSRLFSEEVKVPIGQLITAAAMHLVWRNTAIRELYAELGLGIIAERLEPYQDPFLLHREEGFDLYIKLYTLELQPEELRQIQEVRPNANLEQFNLERFIEFKNRHKLSVFLCTEFDNYILPLVRDALKVI
jgi:predicted phosphohydrolase